MNQNKRILFMGTPDYATVIFSKLLENNYNVIALFTQPDKPVGRKQELAAPHIKKYSIENNLSIPIYQPSSLKDIKIQEDISDLKPDIIVVAAYGQILPPQILNIAPCINLHASLLPKYRGASPIQQALLNNDGLTGVTAMYMDIGLDSGDILGYKYVPIDKDMVVSELFQELSFCAASLTVEVLEKYDTLKAIKQNSSLISHCKKISKKDGLIEFDNALDLYNKYRAFKSWPDIFLSSGLKIKECKLNEVFSINKKSKILSIKDDYIIIGCDVGSIIIYTVQPASKKQMNVVSYIRGRRLEIGDDFS